MSTFTAVVSDALVERRVETVQSLELHRFLGVRIEPPAPGSSLCWLPAGSPAGNNVGVVHGGVLYALLDLACYLAALPLLHEGHNAATADIHCGVLRPAPCDQDLRFSGHILRAGRTLIFGESTCHAGDTLIARAGVTKSVVALKQ